MPPNLNRYLQEPAKLVVYPTQGSESENKLYKDLAERIQKKSESGLSGREARLILDTELKEEDLKGQSVMFLGGEGTNAAVAKIKNQLPKDMEINKNNFLIKNDTYRGSVIALLISLASPFNPKTRFPDSESGASEVPPRPLLRLGQLSGFDSERSSRKTLSLRLNRCRQNR
jgi:hypothetical protein